MSQIPWGSVDRGCLDRMSYKLIIFDLDGTLLDSFPWFQGVLSAMADKYGFERIGDVESMRGKTSHELLEALNVPLWRLPRIASDMRKLKSRYLDQTPLFPGVPQMLSELVHGGLTVAIVTSDSEENTRRALGTSVSCVGHFACGASLFGKARKFKQVMKATGMPAESTLTIGDELRDAEAADAAGIDFAGVSWGYATVQALAKSNPVRIFVRVDEIPVWLLRDRSRGPARAI